MMAFLQLFSANLKILIRNWRGFFWTIALPIGLYVGLSLIKLGGAPGPIKVDYSAYLLPGMIALTITQTGIFGLAYWLVDLRSKGVLKRFMVAPLSNFALISSLISTRLVVIIIQLVILTLIGSRYFHVHVNGSLIAILILCLLGGSIFLSLGFLISTVTKTYEEAAPITTVLNLVFTFLGNIFFPISAFPKVLRMIGEKLPVTYLADGLRINYIQTSTFKDSWHDIFALLIWFIVIFALAIYMFQKTKES